MKTLLIILGMLLFLALLAIWARIQTRVKNKKNQ